MEEKTRVRITVAGTSIIGIVYFLLFALPLPKQLSLKPMWVSAIPQAMELGGGAAAVKGPMLSFRIGERYGYFDRNAGIAFAATRGYGISISDAGYVSWNMRPDTLQFKDPRGNLLFASSEQGYPFMDEERRFVVSSNQEGISELDNKGSILWKRDFPSLITAFASNKDLTVIGTMDGQLFAIDHHGQVSLSFAPGGSRIPCIYGCAISPDGKNIAATSGLDKQRVLVLEKRDEAYRVTWHRWTDSDFRRPVAMSFTPDGRELVFETSGGLGVYDVASRKANILFARDPVVSSAALPNRKLLLALDNDGKPSILVASYDGRGYFSFPYSADEAMLRNEGDSVFFGLRKNDTASLLRLDFVEE